MKIFITGTAGFIGFHLARRLLADGHQVTGFDGLTDYYDVELKRERHALLEQSDAFRAHIGMLEDRAVLEKAAQEAEPDVIVHLAAQAGVRYSLENPDAYIQSNLTGSFNLLEVARALKPAHLLLASTSSVYGVDGQVPFSENRAADHPVSLYAATKKGMETMAHSYAHLFSVPTSCFRFFTVYGPWGRPDMALFRFVDAMLRGKPIDVYGEGKMRRDFTYIDDLVEGIVRLMDVAPKLGEPLVQDGVTDTLSPVAPFRVVNIGGGEPVGLLDFIEVIERQLGKTALRNMLPMQAGDVPQTFADHALLSALTGYRPSTKVEDGVKAFVDWYISSDARSVRA